VFEGLWRLKRQGRIRLRFETLESSNVYPRVLTLTAVRGNVRRNIAVDLSDQRDLVHLPDLNWADAYFKRSYDLLALAWLGRQRSRAIRPFGLNSPAISFAAAGAIMRARIGAAWTGAGLARDFRRLLALPDLTDFEAPPDAPTEPLVLLQTAVWDSEAPDTDEVNEQRVLVIRALRERLGGRFIGGLLPTALARANHPELITDLPVRMRRYPRVVRRALIGVNVRGLHNSVGFKLGEYLAASRCIVGDPPSATLPTPLQPGRHYLAAVSTDELLQACELLLSEPARAAEMRAANWHYYLAQVEPGAQMLRVLEQSFALEAAEKPPTRW
jgi:hypothetical protein